MPVITIAMTSGFEDVDGRAGRAQQRVAGELCGFRQGEAYLNGIVGMEETGTDQHVPLVRRRQSGVEQGRGRVHDNIVVPVQVVLDGHKARHHVAHGFEMRGRRGKGKVALRIEGGDACFFIFFEHLTEANKILAVCGGVVKRR